MKKLLCAAAAVSAVVLSSCAQSANDGVIDVSFDACQPLILEPQDGSAAQRASVKDAAKLWNGVAGTKLFTADDVAASGAAGEAGEGSNEAPFVPVFFDEAGAAFHGQYDDDEGVIYINEGIDSAHARAVTIAHEVGHAFGLFHINKEDDVSVMNNGNLVTEPNSFDRESIEAIWGECGG